MDYKKLAADLLSGCEENCADCEYSGGGEFDCTIAQLAAKAITDLLARAEALRKERDEARQDCAVAEHNHMIEVDRRRAAEARCETLEKMVKEYQEELIPGYRERAERAEEALGRHVSGPNY